MTNPRTTIADIAALNRISVEDLLYGGKTPKLVKARKQVIMQLREDGLGVTGIGYYLELDHSTVAYHFRLCWPSGYWREQGCGPGAYGVS